MNTVVKLTQQSVIGEIESVLDTYPYQPYQKAFAIPFFRQELISFVIKRIPGFSSQVYDRETPFKKDQQDKSLPSKLSRHPLEQKLHLQNLIHQGIFSIIQQQSELISDYLCETVESPCQVSRWFG